MNETVLLDTGVLGLVVHPKRNTEPVECRRWLRSLIDSGATVYVPEIADYELRRELLRIDSQNSIERLDSLKSALSYLPIKTEAMLKAAELCAKARKQGRPTASDESLDGDIILMAQAQVLLSESGHDPVIATTNVGHLSLFVTARQWREVSR